MRQRWSGAILWLAACSGLASAGWAQPRRPLPQFPESALQDIEPLESLPAPQPVPTARTDELLPPPGPVEELLPPTDVPSHQPPLPSTRPRPLDPQPRLGVSAEAGETDLVRERYPDGRVRIERRVALDDDENYVNHGSWRAFNRQGQVLAEGSYEMGTPVGSWRRWVSTTEVPWLGKEPYTGFQAPFLSAASFKGGNLHGDWTLSDAAGRTVFRIELRDGRRQGRAVWMKPDGQPLQEMHFRDGRPHGVFRAWGADGHVARQRLYREGRHVENRLERHPNRRKRAEGVYYHGVAEPEAEDDWWTNQLARYAVQGEGYRQGRWRVWHENGQLQMEGDFHNNQPTGEFSWWYANGQKALVGRFEGGRRVGDWTWWHSNGFKQAQGSFVEGTPTGSWAWWTSDGRLERRAEVTSEDGGAAELPVGTFGDEIPLEPNQ